VTITSANRKAGPFLGNGVTTAFPFSFKVFKKEDVLVTFTSTSGVDADLVLDSDYSVVLNSNQDNNPGGTIIYPISGTILQIGEKLTLTGDLDYTQPTDLPNPGPFFAQVVEDALDRAEIQIQQVKEITDRAIKISVSDTPLAPLPAQSARGNTVIGFDALGNVTVLPIPSSLGAGDRIPYTLVAGADFTPGVSTSVTLPRAPGSPGNLEVHWDGVPRDFSGWSVAGTVLTFTTPIPSYVTEIWGYIGTTLSTQIPPVGSVTDSTVASNAAINSTKLAFIPGYAGAVASRTVDSKLRETVSVMDFDAVGDGVADDTAAFSAAIAYANSLNPGSVDAQNVIGVTIKIPNGRYKITAPVTTILKGSIAIVGESRAGVKLLLSANAPTFTWNTSGSSDLVVNGEFSNCAIEYLAPPGANALIWYMENTYRVHFENIDLINVGRVAQMGSPTRPAGAIYFTNLVGYVANIGKSAFVCGTGAGLFFDSCRLFVPVPTPTPNRTSAMTTVFGTNFLTINSATWDTVQLDNCFIERFYYAIQLQASAGVIINNIYVNNTYFDYIANRVLSAESLSVVSGGVFGVKFTGCWFACWDDTAIYLAGPGAIRVFEFANCNVVSAGAYGYLINGANRVQIVGGVVAGTNRVAALGNLAAIALSAGVGTTVADVTAGYDNTPDGFPWQAAYAVAISADVDYYTISNCDLAGAVQPLNLAINSGGSQNRMIRGNRGTFLNSVVSTPSITSGVPFVNTLAYVIRFNVFGGTVTGISMNGVGINSATSGQFLLHPGDSITVNFSVAPTFSYFGMNL